MIEGEQMMYSNGFAFAIKNNNKPLAEFNIAGENLVYLPFGSEFEIFLKNTLDCRASVEMLVNGINIWGDENLLLNRKSQETIKSFQPSGKALLFEREGCEGNYSVGDPENGKIEVRIRKELPYFTTSWSSSSNSGKWNSFGPIYGGWNSSTIKPREIRYTSSVSSPDVCNHVSSTTYNNNLSLESGVVVEGTQTGERTISSSIGSLEAQETIFRIRLIGQLEEKQIVDPVTTRDVRFIYCTNCGNRNKQIDNFCSKCGTPVVK
jgi:hypothetical protein